MNTAYYFVGNREELKAWTDKIVKDTEDSNGKVLEAIYKAKAEINKKSHSHTDQSNANDIK